MMDSLDVLGLTLWYLKSSGRQYQLAPIFGIVQTSLSVWIDFGLEVLLRMIIQKAHPDMRLEWPTEIEMKASAALLKNRPNGHLLPNVFAVMDGGRLLCADYINTDIQNAYYEGYTGNVEVTNLLVYSFDGCLIHAALNFPGSWHDSRLANQSGLMNDLLSDEKTPVGMAILCDSAFMAATAKTGGKIIRARKVTERSEIPCSELMSAIDDILQSVMPSERQSAEWGVRALKAPFGRLRLPLSRDSERRGRLLIVCAHLVNLRTRQVGLSQIRTTYANAGEATNPWIARLIEEGNRAEN